MPVIPALGFAVHRNLELRKTEKTRVIEGISTLAKLIAVTETSFINHARQLLGTLCEFPPLVLGDHQEFSDVHLQNLLKLSPDYINFGLIEMDGRLFASSVRPEGEDIFLGDRSYFKRTAQSKRFSVGDFQVGRLTGQQGINFGYPVINTNGELKRILFASLNIDLLTTAASHISLPEGAALTILDRNGTIVARLPDGHEWLGKSLSHEQFVRDVLLTRDGVIETSGLDRIKRTYAVTSMSDGYSPCFYVAVGVPSNLLFADANSALIRSLAVLACILVIVFIACSLFAQRVLINPVSALVSASNRVANADLNARADVSRNAGELYDLAAAFNRMAENLQQREKQLWEADTQIQTMNADLEEKVLERTSQLTEANKELESFSYSVSHDLRAPLRHIDGFSQLLKKHEWERMDEKGRRYLDVISQAAKKMGTLIDELLVFSRMGRKEMLKIEVDMNTMVRDIVSQYESEPERKKIHWNIEDLPTVESDPAMIRQVWINLLSNAVKYSQKRDQPKIEVGFWSEKSGEFVFFVRDNGVGFDMRYADKLFGVFQRLHSDAEFEGTGIGLANVRRIVTRHGGRTWAEAKPDEGATFYFSLKSNAQK